MLFDPARHEALGDTAWDASRAREVVRSIVGDIELNRAAAGHWPPHPLDIEGDEPRTGFKGLYLGRAGVLWALWYLQRQGAVEPGSDPPKACDRPTPRTTPTPTPGKWFRPTTWARRASCWCCGA